MSDRCNACCSTPAALLYWLGVTMLAWAILSGIGLIWPLFHATSAITILLALAAGCLANWARHRTYHCSIDGPLFLVAGVIFLLRKFGVIHVSVLIIWIPLFIGVALSFRLEWRLARHSSHAA